MPYGSLSCPPHFLFPSTSSYSTQHCNSHFNSFQSGFPLPNLSCIINRDHSPDPCFHSSWAVLHLIPLLHHSTTDVHSQANQWLQNFFTQCFQRPSSDSLNDYADLFVSLNDTIHPLLFCLITKINLAISFSDFAY